MDNEAGWGYAPDNRCAFHTARKEHIAKEKKDNSGKRTWYKAVPRWMYNSVLPPCGACGGARITKKDGSEEILPADWCFWKQIRSQLRGALAYKPETWARDVKHLPYLTLQGAARYLVQQMQEGGRFEAWQTERPWAEVSGRNSYAVPFEFVDDR